MSIYSRIAVMNTIRGAWNTLQKEFQGRSKVVTMKHQSPHCEFETLLIKTGESVRDFLSTVSIIAIKMSPLRAN